MAMKKYLFALTTLLFSSLFVVSLRADVIYYEGFNYPNGAISTNSGNLWVAHSGTAKDALVNNHKLENAATTPPAPNPISRQDDVNRLLSVTNASVYTNSQQIIYARFTVNCT